LCQRYTGLEINAKYCVFGETGINIVFLHVSKFLHD